MDKEVQEYYEKRMEDEGISMLPGHGPQFKSKEGADAWIEIIKKSFEEFSK